MKDVEHFTVRVEFLSESTNEIRKSLNFEV